MRYICFSLFLLLCISTSSVLQSQPNNLNLKKDEWNAFWIAVPDEPENDYGIYIFRKKIDLAEKPDSFKIHVSADNRYKLFVNEKLVSLGPARGDLANWNYENVDIAPYLVSGKNIVAAKVWNEGKWRPMAQVSNRTGFIIQGDGPAEQILNTNESWLGAKDSSYAPIKFNINTYYVSGPGELVDMNLHIKGWEKADFDESSWKNATQIIPGIPKRVHSPFAPTGDWLLIPSIIPQMELKTQRLERVRKAEGITLPPSFPSKKSSVTFPANIKSKILLDQNILTNAYPTIIFSSGKDASISLSYAEALYTTFPEKGNRNDIEGKTFLGRKDSIISNGSKNQEFTALAWRTYRYILMEVVTKDQPLVLEDIYGTFTGYPFEFIAKLNTEKTELNKMLEIGWRTARLNAVETYMDCPYYEQLQYIGDTRIQALVSLYNSGDDRLLRNALNLIDNSRQPEGVTLSRAPSYMPQFIPTFSLWYIGMLHDYWMYGSDGDFVKNKLPGSRQVLNYFQGYQQEDGSLKDVPNWIFTDWVKTEESWNKGVGPIGKDGNSALLDLQLLWAYQLAADMESKIGLKEITPVYKEKIDQLKKTIRSKYWNENKKLVADRPEKDYYSQHTNSLAILTDMVDKEEALDIAKSLKSDTSLAPASIYFKYYLHQALIKAGLGNEYIDWLDIWRENIKLGLTTWGEHSQVHNTRSDCHAWGSSPNIEFFRTVLGIDTASPGFETVKIEPHLGSLKNISGEIPHPNGTIAVKYSQKKNKWDVEIDLPEATSGFLMWKGKRYPLNSGANTFKL